MSIGKTVIFSIAWLAITASFAFSQGVPSAPAKAVVSDNKSCPPYDDPKIKGDPSPIVDGIDANKDGKMTHEEWTKAGAPEDSWKYFMAKDKDKKGYVTRQEFIDNDPAPGVDLNCDGKFTIEEFHTFGLQGPKGGETPPAGGNAPGGAPSQK
jgi:hypothetical protein